MAYVDAYIEVTIDTFYPIEDDTLRISPAQFLLKSTSDGVRQEGQVFKVSKKARLIFYFPEGNYRPQDIWFIQTEGNDDKNGKKNLNVRLPEPTAVPPKVEVRNELVTKRNASWKILIPITHDDLGVGLIDPEISNTDSTKGG